MLSHPQRAHIYDWLNSSMKWMPRLQYLNFGTSQAGAFMQRLVLAKMTTLTRGLSYRSYCQLDTQLQHISITRQRARLHAATK